MCVKGAFVGDRDRKTNSRGRDANLESLTNGGQLKIQSKLYTQFVSINLFSMNTQCQVISRKRKNW